MITPIPKDIEQTPLQGAINGIPMVQNIVTVSGEWYPVIVLYETKQLILQPRSEITWKYSTTSGGDYFSMRNGAALHAPIVVASGITVGWISSDYAATYELMIGR